MHRVLTRYRRRYDRWITRSAPPPLLIARIGLGIVIGLAGAHKLIAPAVWTEYAAPQVLSVWPTTLLSFETFILANGVIEVLFGVALVAGIGTSLLAGIVALSLVGVLLNLVLAGVTTGAHVDVLIRDLGLATLAVCLTILAAGEP